MCFCQPWDESLRFCLITHFLVSHSESWTLQEGSKTLFLQSSQGPTLRLETGTSPSKQLPSYLLNRLGFYVKFHLAKGFSCFGKETCPSPSQRMRARKFENSPLTTSGEVEGSGWSDLPESTAHKWQSRELSTQLFLPEVCAVSPCLDGGSQVRPLAWILSPVLTSCITLAQQATPPLRASFLCQMKMLAQGNVLKKQNFISKFRANSFDGQINQHWCEAIFSNFYFTQCEYS